MNAKNKIVAIGHNDLPSDCTKLEVDDFKFDWNERSVKKGWEKNKISLWYIDNKSTLAVYNFHSNLLLAFWRMDLTIIYNRHQFEIGGVKQAANHLDQSPDLSGSKQQLATVHTIVYIATQVHTPPVTTNVISPLLVTPLCQITV